ncbi:hypothetical protein F4604DRAFT_1678228 [Suillus subluteus]|nr:hypothetical protein F4604DRAFT_1678228 [Suillus subluteus]
MSKNYIPYPLCQAPLELQFAAHVSGRGCKPEFTAEEIRESKLAGHEAARQRLVTTAWELEESERFTTFLDRVHHENKDRLLLSDEELKKIRNTFSSRSQDLARGSKCKGKAAIPKPARGSGLNPSEQPRMVPFDFDPYGPFVGGQGLSVGGQQDLQQQLFENTEGPSFGHMQGQAPAQGHMQGQALAHGQLPYDHTQGSLYYGDGQGSIPYGDREGSMTYEAGPSSFGHTQGLSYGDGGGALYGDGEAGPSSFSHAQDSSGQDDHNTSLHTNEEGHDFYDHFRDIPFNSGPSFADFPPDHPGQTVPVPWWIKEAPDGGTSITDQSGGLSPPASNLTMIQQGEISASEVVHMAGPARTIQACRDRRANMPATPYQVSRTPTIATEMQTHTAVTTPHETPNNGQPQNVIILTEEVIVQTIKGAKNAMVYSRKEKKEIVDKAITESVPQFYGPDAVFQSFITNAHRKQVGNAFSAKRGKMVDFAQDGACDAFQLFPPQGHSSPADQYRIARVNLIIWGADPLMFMHDFYIDENDNIIVHARFKSRFVMANVIRFMWYWSNASFLDTSSLKTIKNVLGVAGAATHCALCEQGMAQLDMDPFGGKAHHDKFKEIIEALDGLTGAEKTDLEQHLRYILEIGPSQARGQISLGSDSDE